MQVYTLEPIAAVAKLFFEHKLGIIPTDTIYGYACAINDATSKNRIYMAKERDGKKEIGVIVSSVAQLAQIMVIDEEISAMLANADYSITIIGKKRLDHPCQSLLSSTAFVGARITYSDWLRKLIDLTGPLFATSVNLSGQPPINDIISLKHQLADFVVDGGNITGDPLRRFMTR